MIFWKYSGSSEPRNSDRMSPMPGSRVDGRARLVAQTRDRRPSRVHALTGAPTPAAVGSRSGMPAAVEASATAIGSPRPMPLPGGPATVGEADGPLAPAVGEPLGAAPVAPADSLG